MTPGIQEHENIHEHNDETGDKIDQGSHHSTDNSANAAIIFTFKYFFLITGSDSKPVIKELLYIITRLLTFVSISVMSRLMDVICQTKK